MKPPLLYPELRQEPIILFRSIGPTGVLLMMGDVSEETLYDGFRIQAEALKRGGVDAICIETMSALDEACLAIRAARTFTGLEVVCTFTLRKLSPANIGL